MTEEENRLYRYIDDLLTELDIDLSDGSISIKEYFSKVDEIMSHYKLSKGMTNERAFLSWRIENAALSDQIRETCRRRILEIDSTGNSTSLIGAEVDVNGRGHGTVVNHKGDFITVEFQSDRRQITYRLETAIKARSLKFSDPDMQLRYEKHIKPGTDFSSASEKGMENTLDAYLNYVKSAIYCSLTKHLFSVTLVIHSDDDNEYYDSLSKIKTLVFSRSGDTKIYQDTLVSGARRWDSSVESLFKRIFDDSEGIQSVDIRDFSTIDPIFMEVIQSIRSVNSRAKKIFVIRIRSTDKSTPRLIAAKMPVYEIKPVQKDIDEYAEKLYDLFPSRLIGNYEDMKDILKAIVTAEMKNRSFTGEKSLESIALKIAYSFSGGISYNNNRISASVLSDYYDQTYGSEKVKKTALERLRGMIGFEGVVDLAELLIAGEYQRRVLSEKGITPDDQSSRCPHIVFRGDSGCGKTTAARMISEALNEEGIRTGFHEVNSRSLCGRYLGETRINVQTAIKAADGGILFIDEAYALAIGDEYGEEAISTLLTEMENPDSSLIIIFAGYKDEMEHFLDSNPGLRSRIGYSVDFKPYNRQELFDIAMSFLENFEVKPAARDMIEQHFMSISQADLESPNFGLARYSRNIASKIKSASARRHWLADDNSADIDTEDVEKAIAQMTESERPKMIGFTG
ncbi:MAG: AAA family ATPase [Clostridia bacterium]|nr:AAA family ATPase [Clostridia bacterium]